jgi:hypothetical protein
MEYIRCQTSSFFGWDLVPLSKTEKNVINCRTSHLVTRTGERGHSVMWQCKSRWLVLVSVVVRCALYRLLAVSCLSRCVRKTTIVGKRGMCVFPVSARHVDLTRIAKMLPRFVGEARVWQGLRLSLVPQVRIALPVFPLVCLVCVPLGVLVLKLARVMAIASLLHPSVRKGSVLPHKTARAMGIAPRIFPLARMAYVSPKHRQVGAIRCSFPRRTMLHGEGWHNTEKRRCLCRVCLGVCTRHHRAERSILLLDKLRMHFMRHVCL